MACAVLFTKHKKKLSKKKKEMQNYFECNFEFQSEEEFTAMLQKKLDAYRPVEPMVGYEIKYKEYVGEWILEKDQSESQLQKYAETVVSVAFFVFKKEFLT